MNSDYELIARASESVVEVRQLRNALEAVLLFHSGSPWDSEKRQRWYNLTFSEEATTKVLCEFVRYVHDQLWRRENRERGEEWQIKHG